MRIAPRERRSVKVSEMTSRDMERMEEAAFDAAFRRSRWDHPDDPEWGPVSPDHEEDGLPF